MSQLPADAPAKAGDAFARINAVAAPSLDDLKLMVYLEASGQTGYFELAESAPNPAVADLLKANGREEMAHAHRVAKVIKLLSGEDFQVPAAADNKYAVASGRKVDRALLESLVQAEHGGESLYENWANNTAHPEAAAMLRQNGKEEVRHAERAAKAIELFND